MGSILKELWIFSNDGRPLAEFCSGKECNPNNLIMGSFVSAIKIYSEHLISGGLKNFILEKDKFTFVALLQGNLILVCRTSPKIKDKKIKKICFDIVEIFEELYTVDVLKNWRGNLSFFDNFKERLDEYIEQHNI